MQKAIYSGLCPFCRKGFRNIAYHTNKTHGVDRFQLKEMAGIPKTYPACSPELTEHLRGLGKEKLQSDDDLRDRLAVLHTLRKLGPREFSEAGRSNMSRALHEGMLKSRKKTSEKKLDRWAELGKTWDAIAVIAVEFEVTEKSVRNFLRQRGEHVPDGRKVGPLRGTLWKRKA